MFSVHPQQQRACISRSAIPQRCACLECVYRFHLHQYLQNQFLQKQYIERCHQRPLHVNVTNPLKCHTRPSPLQSNVANSFKCHTRPSPLQVNVTNPFNYEGHLPHIRKRTFENCIETCEPQDKKPRVEYNSQSPNMSPTYLEDKHTSYMSLKQLQLFNKHTPCVSSKKQQVVVNPMPYILPKPQQFEDKHTPYISPEQQHYVVKPTNAMSPSQQHFEDKHTPYMSTKQQHYVVQPTNIMSPVQQHLEDKHTPCISPSQQHQADKYTPCISPKQLEVLENIAEMKVEPCDEVVEIKQEEVIIDVEALAPPNENQEDKQNDFTHEPIVVGEMTEIGGGIKIARELDTLLRHNYSKNPAIFLRRLFYKGGVFTLEEIAACSITGKRTPHSPAETRPALDQEKFNVLKDYTIACCDLKPNTAEMIKFEARVRCLCTEARKILRKSTENPKKSK